MVFNNRFILASTSKSRYKILKKNDLLFYRINPNCNEDLLKKKLIKNKTSAKKISLELARNKSKSISKLKKNVMIVGSDTTISFNGSLLSKAKNIKDAKKKIISISGKEHEIYSSASVFYNMSEVWNVSQKSIVKIRKLSEEEIDVYLYKTGKSILNSVGCYQAEALGPNIIENIKGDFFNVMGFPLFPFLSFLKKNKTNIK